MARTKPWELSAAVWKRAEPLLPPPTPHPKGGRPPCDNRQMLGAMLYVLRTGIQWNALPRAIGASTTVYDRFRAWERDGFFARLWAAGLGEFDELVGIEWEWQSLDGVMTKAPFGRAATAEAEGIGHNPTDRGKTATALDGRATSPDSRPARSRCSGVGLCGRGMDLQTGGRGDPAHLWGELPSGPRLQTAAPL